MERKGSIFRQFVFFESGSPGWETLSCAMSKTFSAAHSKDRYDLDSHSPERTKVGQKSLYSCSTGRLGWPAQEQERF